MSPGERLLLDRAVSNLKAWLHGTHRYASPEHLPAYLDEYVFRRNRRGTPHAPSKRCSASAPATSQHDVIETEKDNVS